jgi:hypothetical protein
MKKIVRCVDVGNYEYITKNDIYKVIGEEDIYYEIINDNNEEWYYPKNLFEVTNNTCECGNKFKTGHIFNYNGETVCEECFADLTSFKQYADLVDKDNKHYNKNSDKENVMEDNKVYKVMKAIDENLEFGVKFDIITSEEYIFEDSPYRFEEDGIYDCNNEKYDEILSAFLFDEYTIKLQWRPKIGEWYFMSSLIGKSKYEEFKNTDEEFDRVVIDNGITFKTKEEAIEMTNKILEYVKEIKNT